MSLTKYFKYQKVKEKLNFIDKYIKPLLTIIGIVASGFIGWYGNIYLEQQNEIAKTNNYFTTINNIQEGSKSLELLFFAYKESPEEYAKLLEYYLMKNKKVNIINILEILSNEDKIKLLNLILSSIEEKLSNVKIYYKNDYLKFDNLIDINNIILENMFTFIKEHLLQVIIVNNKISIQK